MKKALRLPCLSVAFLLGSSVGSKAQTKPGDTTPNAPTTAAAKTAPSWILGLGKVKSYRPTGTNQWLITLESPEALLGDDFKGDIDITLVTTPTGVRPAREWLGKTAIFDGLKRDDTYKVFDTFPDWSALSPDGKSLFVWSGKPDADIKAIRKVARLIPIGSQQSFPQATALVEDESTPLFLRERVMEILWGLGEDDDSIRHLSGQKFLLWRDNPKLPVVIRLEADELLTRQTFSYQSDSTRLRFLRDIVASPDATKEQKDTAQTRWAKEQVQFQPGVA